MNTNWAKILLFSLLSFALGIILCMLMCGRCGAGHCGSRAGCHKEASCGHGGQCGGECRGRCDGACSGQCGGKEGAACCKGGHGRNMGHGGAEAIVEQLEASGFQGDTTVAIKGGTVQVSRQGDKTEVRVQLSDSAEAHAH